LSPSTAISRIVLDCLKPHQPPIYAIATTLTSVKGVHNVDIDTVEVDSETESLKMTIDGTDLDFEVIEQKLNEVGVVVHSIDKVVAGHLKT